MEGQVWYRSKLLWLGVLEVGVGIANYIATLDAGTSVAAIAAGILTIIFRYLTRQPLTK